MRSAHVIEELGDRLVYWTAPHPSWRAGADWAEDVGCVLYRAADALVFVDPLVPSDRDPGAWQRFDEAVAVAAAPVAVLLTAPWHERSTREVVDRYGARVWVDPAAQPRFADLPPLGVLPTGVDVFAPSGVDEGQVAFFIAPERTLVVAEIFVGTGAGLQVQASPATFDVVDFARSLRELARLPIERVLVAHGLPVLRGGRDAVVAAVDAYAVSLLEAR